MTPETLLLLQQIFEVCLIPLLGVLTAYVTAFIRNKSKELVAKTDSELVKKYSEMLTDTIVICVEATNQTYVDALKTQGSFDKKAQKKAFEQTKNAVMATLTEESKKYLSEFYGDLDVVITNLIEAQVKASKEEQ